MNVDLEYRRADIKLKRSLEFVSNIISSGEVLIVRTKKYGGLSEAVFAVGNKEGKIIVKQIREQKDRARTTKRELRK